MTGSGASGRILWVTEEAPDRGLGGGSIRQAHLLEALAARYDTDLLVAGRGPDAAVREAVGSVVAIRGRRAVWSENPVVRRALELGITFASPLPSAAYPAGPNRRALARALAERASAYSLICVEHAALAPLARAVPGVPATLTLHHLVSEMVRQELAHTAGARQRWYRARDLVKAQRLERGALARFDRVFTCSEQDAAALTRLAGGAVRAGRVRVIPNGVDLAAIPASEVPAPPRVLFPGSLAYGPNVDGALWFCGEVWPRVRAAVPAAELVLAGREPTAAVRALGDLPGVTVHANVPSMADYLRAARAVVVPLRVGTGTRLKALEAMASGRPVVGTSVGLEGIGIVDGVHALVRDDPESMAAAVVAVLDDDALAGRLGGAGRARVEGEFGWERIGARFAAEIGEVLGGVAQAPASAAR